MTEERKRQFSTAFVGGFFFYFLFFSLLFFFFPFFLFFAFFSLAHLMRGRIFMHRWGTKLGGHSVNNLLSSNMGGTLSITSLCSQSRRSIMGLVLSYRVAACCGRLFGRWH